MSPARMSYTVSAGVRVWGVWGWGVCECVCLCVCGEGAVCVCACVSAGGGGGSAHSPDSCLPGSKLTGVKTTPHLGVGCLKVKMTLAAGNA